MNAPKPAPFDLLDPTERRPDRRALLDAQVPPPTLGDHTAAAAQFQPGEDLVAAINVALAVDAPLLLTGEPGTGKTQVAHYVAWYFEVPLFSLHVRSSTTASDLLYRFDTVAYFHAAYASGGDAQLSKADFVDRGPLWHAFEAPHRPVVLVDEIDKAPRDFPNDLMHVLDQHRFVVAETGAEVRLKADSPPPLVVITSNSERRLPEPFLRRCIFHHIEFTPTLLEKAVAARAADFPHLDPSARQVAMERFLELRGRRLRKKPATAELLVWLTILSAKGGVDAATLRDAPLRALPALAALVKDRDDLADL